MDQEGSNLQGILTPMENYNHITLTEAETSEALRLARKAKDQKLRNDPYFAKVKEPAHYKQLSYDDLKAQVLTFFLNTVGEEFEEDDENREVLDQLLLYFTGDPLFESKYGLSLKKGILLMGPIGCGKTSLMRAISHNATNPFAIKRCDDIAGQFQKYGQEVITGNIQPIIAYPDRNFGHKFIGCCFDDLGTEDISKNFGNAANVMEKIINGRYVNDTLKAKTHITANLTADQIEGFYGTRVRSRLREMCNVISYSPKAKDRRG